MGVGKILAYGATLAVLAVIVFVRGASISGESGGQQASEVINSTTSGIGKILNAAEGFQQ